MIRWMLAIVGIAALAGIAFVRMTGSDPARWHVDPVSVQPSEKPNDYLIAGPDALRFAQSAQKVAEKMHALLGAEPRTERLAGEPDGTWATYVQRSAIIGYPDYLSFHVEERETGSVVAIYSRSRYGYSDMGMNKKRVERVVDLLEKNLQ